LHEALRVSEGRQQHAQPAPANPGGLSISGLLCVRDELPLFEPVALSLQPGQLLLVEGDNGVGKTTLLRALLGLTPMQLTQIQFLDASGAEAMAQLRRQSRWLGHAPALKGELSVAQNWRFWAALEDISLSEDDVLRWGERLALPGFEHATVSTLSAGQKKRAQLARLYFGAAKLWLLDEPFANLDRAGIAQIEAMMRAFLASSGMIIATSHGVLPFAHAHETLHLRRAILL
jgi:heme exporter protein A